MYSYRVPAGGHPISDCNDDGDNDDGKHTIPGRTLSLSLLLLPIPLPPFVTSLHASSSSSTLDKKSSWGRVEEAKETIAVKCKSQTGEKKNPLPMMPSQTPSWMW